MSKEKQQDPTNGEETKAPVEKKTSKIKTGKVANCERLNVRSTPKQEPGNVLVDIPKGTELTIDEDLGDFCKVTTNDGVHGFCMSEFIDKK